MEILTFKDKENRDCIISVEHIVVILPHYKGYILELSNGTRVELSALAGQKLINTILES